MASLPSRLYPTLRSQRVVPCSKIARLPCGEIAKTVRSSTNITNAISTVLHSRLQTPRSIAAIMMAHIGVRELELQGQRSHIFRQTRQPSRRIWYKTLS